MRKVKFLFKITIFCFISFFILLSSLYLYAYLSPSLDIKNAGHLYIYDDNNDLVFQGSSSNRWVELDDISPYLVDAVIAAEDKRFYDHHGFDYLRIAKALFVNFKNKNLSQGASTISQQYIKNLFLDFNKTWKRKADEALLTMKLETHYSKEEILEGYLNTINYGNGNYGIENASNYYFNKDSKNLTLEEALILAGIPKSPANYNPIANYDGAINRAKVIAKSMFDNNMISSDEYNSLFTSDIEIYGHHNSNDSTMIMYYQDAVYNELYNLKEVPNSLIETGGLKVYTSFNQDAQYKMEEAIKKNMPDSNLQVASIIVNPSTGAVMALSGGYDYAVSQFNRALNANRQVGSTIKPILYYAALENGMVSSSTFLSEPTTFVFSENQTYTPNNFNSTYGNKNITMAAAISYSDNIYAVKTHLFLGEDMLVNTAKRMGLKKELEAIPSLALGTCALTMIDYATVYTTLASGGYKKELSFINRVEDMDGNVLYSKKNKEELVLNTSFAYILNEIMTTTYNSAFKDYNIPTVISLSSKISKKYAVKTGSSGSDCWMVGYNPNALMMVWNGYDDNSELEVKDGLISKNIWLDTMETIDVNKDDNWYETPANVVGVPHNAIDGSNNYNNNNVYVFYYIKGSESISYYVNSSSNEKNE